MSIEKKTSGSTGTAKLLKSSTSSVLAVLADDKVTRTNYKIKIKTVASDYSDFSEDQELTHGSNSFEKHGTTINVDVSLKKNPSVFTYVFDTEYDIDFSGNASNGYKIKVTGTTA